MTTLLKETFEDQVIPLDKLITLEAAKIEDADLAHRKLDPEHVEELRLSNPDEWPAILVTGTNAGYVVIDGYHRWEANKLEKRTKIKATCKPYASEQDIIEACFEANLRHGLGLSIENRSNYAYFLHKHYPAMKQEEIAARAHIKQSTVSKAISRRAKKAATATTGHEHGTMRETLHSLDRDAKKFLDTISTLDEQAQRAAILEAIETVEERERLLNFARRLEEILQPPKRRTPKG